MRLSPKGEFEYLQIDVPMPQALVRNRKCWHRHRKLWPDHTINLALAIHGQVDPRPACRKPCRKRRTTPVEVKYLLEEARIRVMVDNDC